jgi:hypothetical protein
MRRAGNISEDAVPMQRRNVAVARLFGYNQIMVDPSMPWSLKGISEEAREYAKQSADDSRTPVGAWLSAVIRSAATHEGRGNIVSEPAVSDLHAAAEPTPPADIRDTGTRSMGSTIERAAQIVDDFGFEPEGPARDADLIDDPVLLQAELMALERRLMASEANTQDNISPLLEEIERIKNRLSALNKH